MNNPNFLPKSLEKEKMNCKIKKYKLCVLILWLFCLVLFVIFINLNGKNKKLKQISGSNNLTINKYLANEAKKEKRSNTISTLDSFQNNLSRSFLYKSVVINDKQIDIDALVNDTKEYYNIVKNIEDNMKYKIIYLSPTSDYNGRLKFKIILEVE